MTLFHKKMLRRANLLLVQAHQEWYPQLERQELGMVSTIGEAREVMNGAILGSMVTAGAAWSEFERNVTVRGSVVVEGR
jgi:hypothetical protein